MNEKQFNQKAAKLAEKFYNDAQALFDHEDMTIEIAENEIFEMLQIAQGYAESAYEATA